MSEQEYEEFTGLVRPEDIGSEVLIHNEWRNILDVGEKFIVTDSPSGETDVWDKVYTRTLRRPIPKKRMVSFWRYKTLGNPYWRIYRDAASREEIRGLMESDIPVTITGLKPFGVPFEE